MRINTQIESQASRWSDSGYVGPSVVTRIARGTQRVRARSVFRNTSPLWRSVHGVTLGGVFYGVKHGARQMLEQGRPGVIINISSVNARQAV